MDEHYERLAEALDRLPNRFPRTTSNIEILVLKKIYKEEARIAGVLTREAETVEAIAPRIGMTPGEPARRAPPSSRGSRRRRSSSPPGTSGSGRRIERRTG